jgi:hypothetical protein
MAARTTAHVHHCSYNDGMHQVHSSPTAEVTIHHTAAVFMTVSAKGDTHTHHTPSQEREARTHSRKRLHSRPTQHTKPSRTHNTPQIKRASPQITTRCREKQSRYPVEVTGETRAHDRQTAVSNGQFTISLSSPHTHCCTLSALAIKHEWGTATKQELDRTWGSGIEVCFPSDTHHTSTPSHLAIMAANWRVCEGSHFVNFSRSLKITGRGQGKSCI